MGFPRVRDWLQADRSTATGSINDFINDPSGYVADAVNRIAGTRDIPFGTGHGGVYTCKYCGRRYKEPQESCRGCGADVF